ncbi:hypothetical protein Q7C36_013251 [Tachysurus vachellii]|uniref:Uncharacterized protein n=1 Tax=Tachysurus vachellii TaxID=175792 RepID=A0AA88MKE5_TACVA|nr:hypothetical protein Q7C36_013251 [Tachysurus vachellii]
MGEIEKGKERKKIGQWEKIMARNQVSFQVQVLLQKYKYPYVKLWHSSKRVLEPVFFTFNAELDICDVENSKFSPPAVYTLPDSAKATRVT